MKSGEKEDLVGGTRELAEVGQEDSEAIGLCD